MKNKQFFLILHDIRSAHNVGAIFRTADGAGVSKLYLTGYTPVPAKADKMNKTQAEKMLEKTALGAQESVDWEQCGDLSALLEKLRQENCTIIALEKNTYSVSIYDYAMTYPAVLILGNEVEGVSDDVLKKCDSVVSLPMRGKKESLNVSVAAGIAMYELLK